MPRRLLRVVFGACAGARPPRIGLHLFEMTRRVLAFEFVHPSAQPLDGVAVAPEHRLRAHHPRAPKFALQYAVHEVTGFG
jgi:hypothetical protein